LQVRSSPLSVEWKGKGTRPTDIPTSDIYTPKTLDFTTLSLETSAVYQGNGLGQVITGEGLTQIATLSPDSYEIRFYGAGSVGPADPVSGLHQLLDPRSRVGSRRGGCWRSCEP
jgi:hypothetical protein